MKIYSYKTREEKAKKTKSKFSLKLPKLTFKKAWTWIFRSVALGVFLIALLFLYYAKDLPDPNKLLERNIAESTKIFARDGSLLYEVHGEAKRTLINLDQVSKYVPQATIAIEDKDFYKHHGISFTGILRSVIRYVINRGPSGGGGSTITQQFVKNAILANKDGIFGRKIPEAILSLTIEAKFSKEEILKLYLNEIPYGRNAYGIEAAAQTFFGKKAIDLNLAESAYLAALPQRTTYFEPYGQHREALDVNLPAEKLLLSKF
jgi:membrane peptidoglycan carboxypeptidase